MMALIPFDYQGAAVRALEIGGEPWFVASDVARVLGYANPRDAIAKHCKGSSKTRHPSAGGEQEVTIIPERDVYRLIMRSKLPAAEAFEEWGVGEVLPSIRKTGGYQVPTTYADALQLAADQARRLEAAQPAIDFYDAVTGSRDAKSMNDVAKVLETGRNRLFEFLREQSVLMQDNRPYQRYVDLGWFRVVEQKYEKPDGSIHINIKSFVFQRGVDGIRKLLKREKAA